MQNIITNYGKNLALIEIQNKISKYVLLGANTADDNNLDKLLSTNIDVLTDYNIDTSTNEIKNYIVTDIKDISNSLVDADKRLIFTIHIAPNDLPEKKYIYAIALLDNDKNIYSINRFAQTFNSIKDAGEIITIKHTILSDEIQERGQLLQIFDKAGDFVSRDEFVFWLENHNHDDATVSLKKFTDTITKINANKVDINTLGNIDLVNSADNSNIVNILNEIIYNIGVIPNLNDSKYTNLVEAINDIITKIGKSEKLSFIANDIYDALNRLYKEVLDSKNAKFADNVSVSSVRWDDKANINFIGSIDKFVGTSRDTIIDAINETYNKVSVIEAKTTTIIDKLGRYSFYSVNKNEFTNDTYHLMFYPEDLSAVDGYVYIILEIINTPLLSTSGLDTPTVNIKFLQSSTRDNSINSTMLYGNYDKLYDNKYDAYGIQLKAGTIGTNRLVEFVFTKLGRVIYWSSTNKIQVNLNYNGEPLIDDSYGNSYINHIVRNLGGDLSWQDIGTLYNYTSDPVISKCQIYNSGLYNLEESINVDTITLRNNVESLAYKKFGNTFKCTLKKGYIRLF